MPQRGSFKPPAEPVVKPYGCDSPYRISHCFLISLSIRTLKFVVLATFTPISVQLLALKFIPASNEPSGMLKSNQRLDWTFGGCREGQICE